MRADRRAGITAELQSIRTQLVDLLGDAEPAPGLGPTTTDQAQDTDVARAATGALERKVAELQAEVQRHALQTSVSKADRSFLENLLAEKNRTIEEWSKVIHDVELQQQALEEENARLRARLAQFEAVSDS